MESFTTPRHSLSLLRQVTIVPPPFSSHPFLSTARQRVSDERTLRFYGTQQEGYSFLCKKKKAAGLARFFPEGTGLDKEGVMPSPASLQTDGSGKSVGTDTHLEHGTDCAILLALELCLLP